MGRASRGKRLESSERRSGPSRRGDARRTTTHWALWLGALGVLVAVGAVALAVSQPGTTSSSGNVQAASDQAQFATTAGPQSLANLKGSKVVLYFYEGAG
jgi:hypothetical protein